MHKVVKEKKKLSMLVLVGCGGMFPGVPKDAQWWSFNVVSRFCLYASMVFDFDLKGKLGPSTSKFARKY